jgi:26S proteasome regulatory subunit T5
VSRQLPYLVGNVVEILDLDVEEDAAEEGANIDLDATRVGKSAVIKTSTRQTIFLPLIGLVDHEKLKPGDLIGVNKDSYLVLDTLPAEYDSRVKAMEVDEKPTEKYTDVGGLDKQIEELVEAVVWPMKEAERFKKIGIKAPKGMRNILHNHVLLLTQCRCSHVRSPRYWQDPSRPSLRRAN